MPATVSSHAATSSKAAGSTEALRFNTWHHHQLLGSWLAVVSLYGVHGKVPQRPPVLVNTVQDRPSSREVARLHNFQAEHGVGQVLGPENPKPTPHWEPNPLYNRASSDSCDSDMGIPRLSQALPDLSHTGAAPAKAQQQCSTPQQCTSSWMEAAAAKRTCITGAADLLVVQPPAETRTQAAAIHEADSRVRAATMQLEAAHIHICTLLGVIEHQRRQLEHAHEAQRGMAMTSAQQPPQCKYGMHTFVDDLTASTSGSSSHSSWCTACNNWSSSAAASSLGRHSSEGCPTSTEGSTATGSSSSQWSVAVHPDGTAPDTTLHITVSSSKMQPS